MKKAVYLLMVLSLVQESLWDRAVQIPQEPKETVSVMLSVTVGPVESQWGRAVQETKQTVSVVLTVTVGPVDSQLGRAVQEPQEPKETVSVVLSVTVGPVESQWGRAVQETKQTVSVVLSVTVEPVEKISGRAAQIPQEPKEPVSIVLSVTMEPVKEMCRAVQNPPKNQETLPLVLSVTVGPVANYFSSSSEPEEVSFTITQPPDSARTVILTASCPEEKKRNGPITSISYNATVTGQGAYQMRAPQGSIAVTSSNCKGTKEIDVVAEAAYSFNVFARTPSHDGEMSTENVTVQAKPPKLEKPDGSQLVQEVEGRSTTSTVTLQVCRCVVSPKDGHIVEAGIILCVKSSTDQCQPESGNQEQTKYSQLPTWKQFMDGGASGSYRVTPDNFHTTIASAARTRRSVYRRVARSAADFVLYTVGDEQCDQVDGSQYCNGPLPEDKTFNVIIWACTSEGCTESDDVIIVRTQSADDGPPVGVIVGAVVAVLVVVIIAAVIIVLGLRRKSKPPVPPPVQLTPIRKPIKLIDFAAHVERLHKDYNLLFEEEFEAIQEKSPRYPQEAALLYPNRVKNRYNILPYDHSRVKLSTGDGHDTDFINANFIPGYTSQREYIATQGPMVLTFSDFWRMVWEQKSSLIVMLSDLQERGRPKVDMYWPELHTKLQYGDIIVELTTSSTLNKFIIRTFRLHKEGQKEDMRRVVQYFIPGWEDDSANLQSAEMLDFISTVRQEAEALQGPIVVHCSNGVGRTGTFIVLDFLKQFVEEHSMEDEVDIFNLVLNMRHKRPLMVHSEAQYVFIHDTLKMIIELKMQKEHIYHTINPYDVTLAFGPNDNEHVYTDLKPTRAK
ncbi:uncharacterized protein LOC143283186 [Babylonia areolata]|uniref:uncharacterized protein LOC143283186 n=1 Tax=Babylonia areolata TaxID=304850 RepID=UPI003FD364D2